MDKVTIECPECHQVIHVPFFRELEAQAVSDAYLLEITAKEKLDGFYRASLWDLIKFWWWR